MSGKERLLVNSRSRNLGKVITYMNHSQIRIELLKLILKGKFKVRGFKLKLTAEKRFVDLLLNSGAGVYNAQRSGAWRR